MTAPRPVVPLWAGRTAALLGIVLVALNMRTAVASLSPITEQIGREIPLDSIVIGIIGAIPPFTFALSGLFTAAGARRFGLERFLVVAIAAMVTGLTLRALAGGVPLLVAGTLLFFVAAGVGNVLLPPLVKRYFADRLGLVTAAYMTAMALSGSMPAFLAAPLADAFGWRVSLAFWAVLAVSAIVPWVAMLAQHRRDRAAAIDGDTGPVLEPPGAAFALPVWRSKLAWSVAAILAVSSIHIFSIFAWLPLILRDLTGATVVQAGVLLAVCALVGLPFNMLLPGFLVRFGRVDLAIWCGLAFCVIGYLGLILAPAPLTVVWIVSLGAGQLLFAIALTLINLRSRTHGGAVALSAFAQGAGYAIGATGPLVVGLLHAVTGGWTVPLLVLAACAIAAAIAAPTASSALFIEDELAGAEG